MKVSRWFEQRDRLVYLRGSLFHLLVNEGYNFKGEEIKGLVGTNAMTFLDYIIRIT